MKIDISSLIGDLVEATVKSLKEDSDYEEHCSRIDRIVCESMEQVTTTVPIEAEYAVSRCWSKSAKLCRTREGVITPWEPGAN